MMVGAYDGTLDFAGTSGTSQFGVLPSTTVLATTDPNVTDVATLSEFTGSGRVPISLSSLTTAQFNSSGGNTVVRQTGSSQADVVVKYSYLPASSVACFAVGTHIATPAGPVPVEHLCIGDSVRLARGGTAPITWTGHRTLDCARHSDPDAILPVRIAAGAFGRGTPSATCSSPRIMRSSRTES